MSLVEMLVAMAISLLMMAAVANLFAIVGNSVSASRASIGLSEAQRTARNKLQSDLGGITAPMLPPLRPEEGNGMTEIIEGPTTDYTAYGSTVISSGGLAVDTLTGDPDDILMFTTRAKDGQPFYGKIINPNNGAIIPIESQIAEVVWFAVQNGPKVMVVSANQQTPTPVQLYTLYRRVLLVAPEYSSTVLSVLPGYVGSNFFNQCDISAHFDMTAPSNAPRMVLNTLSDLTKHENRFGHDPTTFPFRVYLPPIPSNGYTAPSASGLQGLDPFTFASGRAGEDVILTNVLAFDVRVYDPAAPLIQSTNGATALGPSDTGYWNTWSQSGYSANSVIGYGDYVDLGYGVPQSGQTLSNLTIPTQLGPQSSSNVYYSIFSGPPLTMPCYQATGGTSMVLSQWSPAANYSSAVVFATYDTWSLHYETFGPWTNYPFTGTNTAINFNTSGTYLNGVNNIDDDGDGVVDNSPTPSTYSANGAGTYGNAGEFQYPAPYPVPLRGIQVRIRTYEPDSRQVREMTVMQDFLPQ